MNELRLPSNDIEILKKIWERSGRISSFQIAHPKLHHKLWEWAYCYWQCLKRDSKFKRAFYQYEANIKKCRGEKNKTAMKSKFQKRWYIDPDELIRVGFEHDKFSAYWLNDPIDILHVERDADGIISADMRVNLRFPQYFLRRVFKEFLEKSCKKDKSGFAQMRFTSVKLQPQKLALYVKVWDLRMKSKEERPTFLKIATDMLKNGDLKKEKIEDIDSAISMVKRYKSRMDQILKRQKYLSFIPVGISLGPL